MRTSKVMPLRVLIGSQRIASAYSEQRTLAAQFQVISTAPNLQNPPRKAGLDPKPDVILIDMATAIEDGGKVIKNLVRRFPEVRIILYPDRSKLSGLDREKVLATAIRLMPGNRGDIDADQDTQNPRPQTSVASQGKAFVRADDFRPPSGMPREVTDREYEVLALLAAGCAMKEVAYRLGITYRTVTFHKYRMMQRLGIKRNAGLMTYAFRRSLNSDQTIAA